MGYLVSAHVVPIERDFGALGQLPDSFGYAVYFHETAKVYLVDLYLAQKPPQYPFCSLVPTSQLPSELPEELQALNRFHDVLAGLNRANGIKRSYVFVALLLSRWLGSDVLSFVSDDDELDFACTVRGGDLSRLRGQCDDLLVTYDPAGLVIDPLIPEDEEEDGADLTDLTALRQALPFASIRERTAMMPTELHFLVAQEVSTFTGFADRILGLGSFDPPEDEPHWRKVAQR